MVFIKIFVIETKGKSLEEIEQIYARGAFSQIAQDRGYQIDSFHNKRNKKGSSYREEADEYDSTYRNVPSLAINYGTVQ